MSHSTLVALVLAVSLAIAPALADDGNGNGNAYLKHTPVEIGGTLHIQWGSPTAPFGQTLLVISDGIGPSTWPGLGLVCLDLFSPGTQIVVDQTLDAMGNASISVDIPDLPGLTTLAPIFACALVVDSSLANPFSITKTVGFYLENPDSYSSASGNLGVPRAFHTATALAADAFDDETEVLVAGGGGALGAFYAPSADATTELFSPLTRTFRPGPMMGEARVMHRAVRLASGLVLICGGRDAGGNATSSCELFDPVSETLAPTGAMIQPRIGHEVSLLANGNVLVTGGLANFVGSILSPGVPSSALATGEIYDATTGTWTPVPGLMASPRFAHSHVALNDGRILVAGGIDGGFSVPPNETPTYTATCDFYNPFTNAFQIAPSLATARGGHAASRLGNGDVLITGGLVPGLYGVAGASCERYDGSNWVNVPPLPTTVAHHSQVAARDNGDAIIMGGHYGFIVLPVGVPDAVRHDGAALTSLAAVGTNPGDPTEPASPRGGHTCTPLPDGTLVIIGGSDGVNALTTCLVYLEG